MLFLLEWKIKENCIEKALNRFITSSNSMENGKIIEKYHSPGSFCGWILAESDNVPSINKYVSEESDFLDWNIIPVLKDKDAQLGLSYQLKYLKKN